jgi:hypothetical protein
MSFRLNIPDWSGHLWYEQLRLIVLPFDFWVVSMLVLSASILFTGIGRTGPLDLSQTHQYFSQPDGVACRQSKWQIDDDEQLVIKQMHHRFYVTNLSVADCLQLKDDVQHWIDVEPLVPLALWHDDFVVYQLGEFAEVLAYDQQVERLAANYQPDDELTFEVLFMLWFIFWTFRMHFLNESTAVEALTSFRRFKILRGRWW